MSGFGCLRVGELLDQNLGPSSWWLEEGASLEPGEVLGTPVLPLVLQLPDGQVVGVRMWAVQSIGPSSGFGCPWAQAYRSLELTGVEARVAAGLAVCEYLRSRSGGVVKSTSFLSLVPSLQEVQREGGACLEFQKAQVLPAPRRNCSVEPTATNSLCTVGEGRGGGVVRDDPHRRPPILEKPYLWASEIQWTLLQVGHTLRYLWALGSQMGVGSCQG